MSEVQGVDGVVTPAGDVLIPSQSVRRLALVPGQHVHVVVTAPQRRQNMYGVLAGTIPDLDPEELSRVRRDAWGELASGSE